MKAETTIKSKENEMRTTEETRRMAMEKENAGERREAGTYTPEQAARIEEISKGYSVPSDKAARIFDICLRLMTPKHPLWDRFADLLYGPEGCDWQEDSVTCEGDQVSPRQPLARKLLAKYFPEIDVEGTMAYFDERGGCCDCEILMNVDPVCSGSPDMKGTKGKAS